MFDLITLGKMAKKASQSLCSATEEQINQVLCLSAKSLLDSSEKIKKANLIDIENARRAGKSDAFIDRLTITDKVLNGMAEGLIEVSKLPSPIGKKIYDYSNEDFGIKIEQKKVPFGVIGIIFESRPNVSADAFALCFKTRNAVILRGGSDAIQSNTAIVEVISSALEKAGFDKNVVSVLGDTSHETAIKFMQLNKYIDLLIPRGGAKLIDSALKNATVPIIETGKGNCHVYIDDFADVDMAVKVVFNAKTQRNSVCNACESLVISSKIIDKVIYKLYDKLQEKSVEMRVDERAYALLKGKPNVIPAEGEDFYAEYCDDIISVKVVDTLSEAIDHINEHSTHHSESIITSDKDRAEIFSEKVDSACVYHNASTRFSDGAVFGLGAEIGISTQKLHARGPMGLDALTTTKYVVKGNGAIRK